MHSKIPSSYHRRHVTSRCYHCSQQQGAYFRRLSLQLQSDYIHITFIGIHSYCRHGVYIHECNRHGGTGSPLNPVTARAVLPPGLA